MKKLLKRLLYKLPLIKGLNEHNMNLTATIASLNETIASLNETIASLNETIASHNETIARLDTQAKLLNEKQGLFPPGHFYSPIPDQDEVLSYFTYWKPHEMNLPEIALNKDQQFRLLEEYRQFYNELPFPEKQGQDCRYYLDNDFFAYSDGIFLYSFLRKHQPKRIIEIGSGFSSAVILDTVEKFFLHRPEITFIEPYPERLNNLITAHDKSHIKIFDKKIQDVCLESPELFLSIESGDFLFIDSSHVVKCGSDLQLIMFKILPLLPPGVFVHFHDIFYPFEYPLEWLKDGRYWNENYLVRAFLAYNDEWNIYFFNTYVATFYNIFIKENLPLCFKNPGGSLYIQRKKG
jgi:uncharacterized coiled-coil protein SlyX/predicted O-methyltransferase YrrM